MKEKQKRYHIVILLLVISCSFVLFCCAPEDPAETAAKVARDWTAANVDNVSKSIAGLLAQDNPLLQTAITMTVGKEISERISWEYSQPRRLDEGRYEVIATAYTMIEIPLLGNYRISVNYILEIDTNNKTVINAVLDARSFTMQQQ